MSTTEQENIQNGKAHPTSASERGLRAAALYLLENKKDGFMWVSRLATLVFTFFYMFAFLTNNPYSYYYKALIANCVTSIVRLNQRLPTVQFSRVFLAQLLSEDSCHYVLFSLIFLYTPPVTLVLFPVALFAFLHSINFNLKLLQICGWENDRFSQILKSIAIEHSNGILRLVAYTEIFLMPLNIFMLFMGRGSLLTQIIYYRFLTLRYQSNRNPYSKSVFAELRLLVEILASKPYLPQIFKLMLYKLVKLVSWMAPPVATS